MWYVVIVGTGAGGAPVAALRGLISVEPQGFSRLVKIGVDHRDPQRAVELTSTLARVYLILLPLLMLEWYFHCQVPAAQWWQDIVFT